ncbi:MAG: anhydro-N-acetylmuramic acid kinase [Bacteroidota bacterium]
MVKLSTIGLMSGSSLDGLDIAWCTFHFSDDSKADLLSWELVEGTTIPYPAQWVKRLKEAPLLNGRDLWLLHTELGHYFGQLTKDFLEHHQITPDLVASHGHTIFHFPDQRTTTQIGDGAAIAATASCIAIDQFRSLDMALGGQGAPLAPLADKYLFGQYFGNLNLGGIANISIRLEDDYLAFDIGGANQVLDALMQEIDRAYDDQGLLARSGRKVDQLIQKANQLAYFSRPYPKSLGNDWVQQQLLPIFQDRQFALADRLCSFVDHLAGQIAKAVQTVAQKAHLSLNSEQQILVAGGGGFNTFLCERIQAAVQPVGLIIAEPDIIAYKEAALIALAGALRWQQQPNVFPAVTGASRAAVGGAVHYGLRK